MEQLCSALLTSVTLLLEACLVCLLLVPEVARLLLVTEDEDVEDTEDLMVDTELELLTVRCNPHTRVIWRVHQS